MQDVSARSGDPHAAATVIVLRPSSQAPFKVLLLKRNDTVAFMAGAFVFPGGRVDPADRQVTVNWNMLSAGKSKFPDLTPGSEWAYRVAAVRELAEEAAVQVDPVQLVPVAHWVTPEGEPRRYDTRFFIVRMPDGQHARYDEAETTAMEWLAPADATRMCERGEIRLPPPTWTMLKRLGRLASIDDVFAWARAQTIVRVQPNLYKSETQTMLTLPGDPLHPAPAGWEIPDDTRFVLHGDQGWRPTRA